MNSNTGHVYNDLHSVGNRLQNNEAIDYSQDGPRRSRSVHQDIGRQQQYELADMEKDVGLENGRETNELRRRKTWSAANNDIDRETAKLLADLPSRQLETLATSGKGTVRLNHRRMKSLHGYDGLDGRTESDEIADIVNNSPELEGCTEEEIQTLLKEMTTTLSSKRAIRRQVSKKRRQLGWFTRMKYDIAMSWQHFKHSVAELMYSLELWKSHLKLIEGHFGTGVTSYFLFLKWLFLINIPIFLLTLGFVVLPQVLHRWHDRVPTGYQQTNVSESFTGSELLTGKGWFEDTELYYGFYTNETIQLVPNFRYNMMYAYLFTSGGYYLLCLFILAISILRSYRKYYVEGSGGFNYYFKVFDGWDYGITSQEAARLKQKSLYSELMEYLSGFKKTKDESLKAKCRMFWVRLLTNLVVLAMLGASGYLIYYISVTMRVRGSQWLEMFAMPLCITAINLILPPVFNAIEMLEAYAKPKTQLYIHMIRTMTLKGVTLVVLVNFWFSESTRSSKECWENFMAQEIYRLVIVDFIFTLLVTFLFEFMRKILAKYCIKRLSLPEFNIGRNTMDLIYSQTLCWLGTFYCPLLSFIVIIKLVIIFYVKRVSVLQNCQPSMRPWRAARAHTIFLGFLFCFFLLSTVAVACGIIFVQPSKSCGPFKELDKTYDVVLDLIDLWKQQDQAWVILLEFVSSPGFIAAVVIFLGMGTYYMRLMMIGHKEMVMLLEQQLALEGKDKNFLLQILQSVNQKTKSKEKGSRSNRPFASVDGINRQEFTSPDADDTCLSPRLSGEEGGRTFIKQVAESTAKSAQN